MSSKELDKLKTEFERIKGLATKPAENWYDYESKRHLGDYASGLGVAISILEGRDHSEAAWKERWDLTWMEEPHGKVEYKIELKIDRSDGKQMFFNRYGVQTVWQSHTYSGGELAAIAKTIEDVINGIVQTKQHERIMYS